MSFFMRIINGLHEANYLAEKRKHNTVYNLPARLNLSGELLENVKEILPNFLPLYLFVILVLKQ